MTSASLRLRPRLFMLAHSGRHLFEQVQAARHQLRSCAEYTSAEPIDWELLMPRPELRQTQVESLSPLQLPQQAGIAACMHGEDLTAAASDMLYQLPELVFDLLDPENQAIQTKTILCGRFRTFAHGTPERQLLEYLAATLNFELNVWGWSCQRQGGHLVFAAHPLLAGWNLRLREARFAADDLPRCAGGLKAGLSSNASGQLRGRQALAHWGPWLVNGQRCEVAVPFADADSFAEMFLTALNAQLGDVSAVWTPAGHLLLMPRRPGEALDICDLPAPAVDAPDFVLTLPLPIGRFGNQVREDFQLAFTLNDVRIALAGPPATQAEAWLCAGINAHSHKTGVQAEVTTAGQLRLRALQPLSPLTVAEPTEWAHRALGLVPFQLGDPAAAGWLAALERWTQLLNQFLAEAPVALCAPLAGTVAAVPAQIGTFADGNLSWLAELPVAALDVLPAYLEMVLQAIDGLLSLPELQAQPTLKPLQLELDSLPAPPARIGADQAPETASTSTFDHQI